MENEKRVGGDPASLQVDLPALTGKPIPILYVQRDGTGVPVVKKGDEWPARQDRGPTPPYPRSQVGRCVHSDHLGRGGLPHPRSGFHHLFVGSGVIEAACKTVIASRLKRSGMFWTVQGANAILAVRCSHLNGRFEDYWEARWAA